MKYLRLLVNEFKMTFWGMKRYLLNTVAMVAIMLIIFTGLFYGAKHFGGPAVSGEALDGLILGYVMWMCAMMMLQDVGTIVIQESQQGTLEQLYLSPLPTWMIFGGKIVGNLLFYSAMVFVIIQAEMLLTGRYIYINYLVFYPGLFVSLLSLIGIGFALGGLALVHKRIGAINGILSFGIVLLLMLPTWPFSAYSLLPYVPGAQTLNAILLKGKEFPLWWYLYILGNGLFYLVLGMLGFKAAERRARTLNKLGQY